MKHSCFLSNFSSFTSPIVLGMLLASHPVMAGKTSNPVHEVGDTASTHRTLPTMTQGEDEIPVAKAFWEDTTSQNFYRVGPNIERLAPEATPQAEGEIPPVQKIRSAFFAKARERDELAMLALATSYLQEDNFSEALEWHILALANSFCKTQKINQKIFNKIEVLSKTISDKKYSLKTDLKKGPSSNPGAKKSKGRWKSELQEKIQFLTSLFEKSHSIIMNINGNKEKDQFRTLGIENFLDRLLLDERQWDKGAEAFYNLYFVMKSFDQTPLSLVSATKVLLKAGIQYKNQHQSFLQKGKRLARHLETLFDREEYPSEPLREPLFALGVFHTDGLFLEDDPDKYYRAAQLYEKSGTQKAFYNLGALYTDGKLTHAHENPQQELTETQRYVRAAQFFEKAQFSESYERLGDLYALDHLTVDHLKEDLPELTQTEMLSRQVSYYFKAGSPCSLEHLYSFVYLDRQPGLDDAGLLAAGIEPTTLQVDYRNWLEAVRRGQTKVHTVATEAILHLKGVLGKPETKIEKAIALLKTHSTPSSVFQHVGGTCLYGDLGLVENEKLRYAATMFRESGSLISLRMLAIIHLNLKELDLAEAYALQAQAMGQEVDDVFEYLDYFKALSSDSVTEEEGAEEEVFQEETSPAPELLEPVETQTETPLFLEVKTETLVPQKAIESEKIEPSPLSHLSQKERKQAKKLEKSKRDRELITLLEQEHKKLTQGKKGQSGPWTVVNAEGEPYTQHKSLVADILGQPWGLQGVGKPEILKNSPKGLTVYTRRIDLQHRLVYVLKPETQQVVILKDAGHYTGNTVSGDYDMSTVLKDYLGSSLYRNNDL